VDDAPCVVQFPHPGAEHGPDPGGDRTRWPAATSPHGRKFMLARGTWRRRASTDDMHGELTLWGEWEADSSVRPVSGPVPGGPAWIHRPLFLGPGAAPRGVVPQNTDPVVFGERFLYTFCRQRREERLRRLARGSVILFGSCIDGSFVLDTVFVVAGGIDHTREDHVRTAGSRVDEVFRATTLDPMYAWDHVEGGRLHFGATARDPVAGMFSFAPCLPAPPATPFARPRIELPGLIEPGVDDRARVLPLGSADDVAVVWRRVVAQVESAGLTLAVGLDLPGPGPA
jgi:hypothetical protein